MTGRNLGDGNIFVLQNRVKVCTIKGDRVKRKSDQNLNARHSRDAKTFNNI